MKLFTIYFAIIKERKFCNCLGVSNEGCIKENHDRRKLILLFFDYVSTRCVLHVTHSLLLKSVFPTHKVKL